MQQMRYSVAFAAGYFAILLCTTMASAAGADQKALAARVEQLVGQVTRSKSGDIVAIDLNSRPATDDDLQLLVAAPNLQKLVVWGVGISDAGLDHLLALPKLDDLGLLNTRITDAGLAKLIALKKLKSLDLQRDTGITDDGLAH